MRDSLAYQAPAAQLTPTNRLIPTARSCAIAPSYAAKLVAVQRELQRRRAASNVFAGRHGFITPRDLFRWGFAGRLLFGCLACKGGLANGMQ